MSDESSLTVRKAMRLLFEIGQGGATRLADLVERTGLSKTVCHRLLATLEQDGLIERPDDSGRYGLGTRLIALAGQSLAGNELRGRAAPLMDEIARKTSDAVMLFVPSRQGAMCLERRDGDSPIRPAGVDIGGSLPYHTGAAPLVLLSYMDEAERERILAEPLATRTARSVTDPAQMRQRIAEVRRQGFAIGDEDAINLVIAIGAPILGRDNKLLGALSVGSIKSRYPARRIKEVTAIVREAAARIGALFGGGPPSGT